MKVIEVCERIFAFYIIGAVIFSCIGSIVCMIVDTVQEMKKKKEEGK